jgi:hypothetical protein
VPQLSLGGNSGVKDSIAEDLVKTGCSGVGFEMHVNLNLRPLPAK